MAYPTLAECKTYIGGTGTGQDAVIQWLLDGAVVFVEKYCGRKFVSATGQMVYVVPEYPNLLGMGRRTLIVRGVDLVSVTAITNGDGEVLSSGDYRLLPRQGPPYYLIELGKASGKRWSSGDDGLGLVAIEGTTGSATTPGDVFYAIQELVSYLFRARSSGAAGAVTTATREGLVIKPGEFPPHVLAILENYRRGRL